MPKAQGVERPQELEAGGGNLPELQLAGALVLNQLLYDEPTGANFSIQQDIQVAVKKRARLRPWTSRSKRRFFEIFRDYMVQEGLEAAPELRLSESQIRAQERQLTANKRAFWLPTFALRANV